MERQRLISLYGSDEALGITYNGEVSVLPNGSHAVICSNVAQFIIEKEGKGKVMGFYSEDNPTSEVSKIADGHDFAVIGDFIVDPWVCDTENLSEKSVFHMVEDAEEIGRIYGDKSTWKELED